MYRNLCTCFLIFIKGYYIIKRGEVYPILLEFGRLKIYSIDLLFALAIMIGGLVIFTVAKREKLVVSDFINFILWIVFAGFLGAKLFYLILYFSDFKNLSEVLKIWQGGLVSWGGYIFGFLAGYIWLKREGKSPAEIMKWFGVGALGLLAGIIIGRIGCFLNGCDYGKITDSALGVVFRSVDSAKRHPTQLYESIFSLIVFMGLGWLYFKKGFNLKLIFWFFIVFYSMIRFIIDFYREGMVFWLFLTLGQWFSLILIIIAMLILYQSRSEISPKKMGKKWR